MQLEVLKNWIGWMAKWIAIAIVVSWAIGQTPYGRDDSDSGSWGGGRSGMNPKTDALTGCQYLLAPDGGITPRLDVHGRQIGCSA